jgi:endonuclease-3
MQARVKTLLNFFKKRYGLRVRISDPYRVLITTILSQRTKDKNTEVTSERLFSVYKTPQEIANAPINKIQKLIKSSGFFRVKAARIKEVSSIVVEKFDGRVPSMMEDLLSLPGVGRKTANCVLAFGFNVPAFPVDTHVHRISNRLGLAFTNKPKDTEEAIKKVIPKEYWNVLNPLFVRFGQEICRPINPKCQECGLRDVCLYYFLLELPENFRENILEFNKRILKRFNDVYSIVLIGDVAEGSYNMDSNIDVLCVKRDEASVGDITEITRGLDKVQPIFVTEENIAQHFKDSTTLASAIKSGKIIFETNDFWRTEV